MGLKGIALLRGFEWNELRERALSLIAQGAFTFTEIAEQLDISTSTLKKWYETPEFKNRLDREVEHIRTEIRRVGIADQNYRILCQNRRHRALMQIVAERAEEYARNPDLMGIPGGETGLLVHQVKPLGKSVHIDKDGHPQNVNEYVTEHVLDVALCKELRELETMARRETGQDVSRMEIDYKDERIEASLERKLTDLSERIRTASVSRELVRRGTESPVIQMELLGSAESASPGGGLDGVAGDGGTWVRQDQNGSGVDP